ncbi:MAG: hypothetical protein AAB674_01355 [Patescibacteria group bacterium]
MIEKKKLLNLYKLKKKSMQEIADLLGFSLHKVSYWMEKHEIKSRSRSEAIYLKCNPDGDPFNFIPPRNLKEAELFGLGLGLYWGEGTKANKDSIRLGNTDPKLIKKFMDFLIRFFSIKKEDLRFGLQIFTDINKGEAMDFWQKELKIKLSQFYKPIITKSRSLGTYRKKSQFGVMTIMYHNKKLRDLLVSMLPM